MKKYAMGVILASMIFFIGSANASITQFSPLPSMNPYNGYAFSSETQVASQVADDFLCLDGNAITGLTWWGSYWNPTDITGGVHYPYRHSDGWGDPAAGTSEIITGFNITFYQDVPAGSSVPSWGHPGGIAGQTYYFDLANITIQNYGTINRAASTQTVFQYDIVFNNPFEQTMGNIYWLSIQAVDRDGAPVQWGWQESEDVWNSNAVQTFPGNPFVWDMLAGENMAFELKAVPAPASLLLMASGLLVFIRLRRKP